MEQHTIIRLTDRPEYKESMAQWFHEKWGIPKQAYLDSMDACLKGESAVPQWYAVVEDGRIIGGLGVIENDFHDRKDLSPNVCAGRRPRKYAPDRPDGRRCPRKRRSQ